MPASRGPTVPAEIPDLYDPRTFLGGVPHDAFARLRREAPVAWHPERAMLGWPSGPGFWGVFRHADVAYVNRHPELFSSQLGATQIRDPSPTDLAFVREMLLNMDPPEHTKLRRAVNRAFTPRAVARMEATIVERAEAIVAAVRDRGEGDFVRDIGTELPLLTLAEIMGVPVEDRQLLYDWSNRIIGYQDVDYGEVRDEADAADPEAALRPPPVNPRSRAALTDMFDYAHALAERKLREPGEDVLSMLLRADVDGEAITVEQYENFFFLLAVAGNETLRNGIPGGMLALLEHPAQLRRLRDDLSLLPTAVEELLRFHAPVTHFRRTATADTELAGVPISAGDKVVVFYASANRDPAVFGPTTEELDLTRAPNEHLSFGVGPHVCLGIHVARTQLRAMFSAVLRGLPEIELDGEPVRLASSFQAGFKRLPVRWRP